MSDYLEMARECGAIGDKSFLVARLAFTPEQLSAFAELVRQDERERCATVCDERAEQVRKANTHRGRIGNAATFAADQVEFAAAVLRNLPAAAILAQPERAE